MKHCVRCILPDTFPKITFDEKGICSYCRKNEKFLNPETLRKQSAIEIQSKIGEAKAMNRPYDALMCYSGGKDSTYTLIQAKEKHNLRVLAFTLDNGFLSDLAVPNIQTIVDRLRVDHVFFRPAKEHMKEIFRSAATEDFLPPSMATRISSICYSCISIVNTFAFNMAVEKEIPLIFAGFNLGQIPMNSVVYQFNPATIAEFREQVLGRLLAHSNDSIKNYFRFTSRIPNPLPTYVNPMAVETLSEEQIIDNIKAYGWKLPVDVDSCSTNCRLNQLANCLHKQRFKFSPYALELAIAIEGGLVDRQSAFEKIQNDYNTDQVARLAQELGLQMNSIGE